MLHRAKAREVQLFSGPSAVWEDARCWHKIHLSSQRFGLFQLMYYSKSIKTSWLTIRFGWTGSQRMSTCRCTPVVYCIFPSNEHVLSVMQIHNIFIPSVFVASKFHWPYNSWLHWHGTWIYIILLKKQIYNKIHETGTPKAYISVWAPHKLVFLDIHTKAVYLTDLL